LRFRFRKRVRPSGRCKFFFFFCFFFRRFAKWLVLRNRLTRQESTSSPFLRRKSPRPGAFENNEQLSQKVVLFVMVMSFYLLCPKVRDACAKTDAGLIVRMLASVALSLEAHPSEHSQMLEVATDQDMFFEGLVTDLPARAILKELCRQMKDKASFELVSIRFREWWPNPRLISGMSESEGVLVVLRVRTRQAKEKVF
jgi:hypothetical protein